MNLTTTFTSFLIGGAIGDAYGHAYEGHLTPTPTRIPPTFVVSDDTQLTLATCEALSAHQERLPEQVAQHMLRWYRMGRLSGLGASTTKALQELSMGGHWALVGRKGEHAAGNGAAMRIGPLAFLEPEISRETLRDVCRITHHSEEAYIGALAIFLTLRRLIFDAPPSQTNNWLLEPLLRQLPDTLVRDRLHLLSQQPHMSIREMGQQYGSSGYVVDSVPLALYAAQKMTASPDTTAEIFAELVRAGGDTDTTCFLVGQLIGVRFGEPAFPSIWQQMLRTLPVHEWIEAARS